MIPHDGTSPKRFLPKTHLVPLSNCISLSLSTVVGCTKSRQTEASDAEHLRSGLCQILSSFPLVLGPRAGWPDTYDGHHSIREERFEGNGHVERALAVNVCMRCDREWLSTSKRWSDGPVPFRVRIAPVWLCGGVLLK